MAITGLFSRNRPKIGDLYFDALLEESSELRTDVSEFPLEDASTAQDNAVTRSLALTMTIAVSDNWYRVLMSKQSDTWAGAIGMGASLTTGMVASMLPGGVAALAGIGASVATSIYSGEFGSKSKASHSQELLAQLRAMQRNHQVFELVASRGASYKNCIITNTRTQTNKQNEGGLEIVVDLLQLTIIYDTAKETNNNLPYGDTAATQGQREVSVGEVAPSEVS